MTEQNPQGTETDPAAITTEPAPATEAAPQGGAEPNGTETDWKAHAREWERRAKVNAEAAKKLAEIEQAQKTEEQRRQEQLEEAIGRASRAENELARERVARRHGLDDEMLQFLFGETEEELETRAKVLAERLAAGASRNRRPDPSQGHSSGGAPSLQEQIRDAESKGDTMRAIALKNQLLKK